MQNFAFSHCTSCDGFAVWVDGRLVYPERLTAYVPHEEMPLPIRTDFEEAATIFDTSPRGAAMYEKVVPETMREAIEKRDAPKK
jgi:hypothetical protein